MRLTRIETPHGTAVCRLDGAVLVELPFASMTELLNTPDLRAAARRDGRRWALEAASFAPVVDPAQTLCVGLNYRSHIIETGKQQPAYPTLFAKFPNTLTGPRSDIRLPMLSGEVDWEVELGIVIGARARNVAATEALEYVAGYTVVNDISMRDWQGRTSQWLQGKNFEATTPVGPYLVTPDEIDHARDLRITCSIGGETMQDGRTSDLLFGAAELIAYISVFCTLSPGDLIATGTPGGTGAGLNPKRFLKADEILRSEIEGIGALSNRMIPDRQ